MALTPRVKDLKSLVQVAKDILVLEEMVQHQDVKYWKEPVYDNAREHDWLKMLWEYQMLAKL